ncbi:uncharacterized protein MELLADRAFT_65742 [Melampsora larici-populina 98AG31]|uniref:Uncharacterized protein n=1 Tax=Melampsora larici-populina (strain 98AG31 / pathotype 3-4-7) TaxID=747676 RepID=F4RWJ2_MELLP|nr:uncharacterized protein MELLADRAFT_65742 [Melampsora larici-populina 98AG31]EGG03311.1 hypothetical protein MELLADRAFT_65742 [Melampsora larici-populina 98AG31]
MCMNFTKETKKHKDGDEDDKNVQISEFPRAFDFMDLVKVGLHDGLRTLIKNARIRKQLANRLHRSISSYIREAAWVIKKNLNYKTSEPQQWCGVALPITHVSFVFDPTGASPHEESRREVDV